MNFVISGFHYGAEKKAVVMATANTKDMASHSTEIWTRSTKKRVNFHYGFLIIFLKLFDRFNKCSTDCCHYFKFLCNFSFPGIGCT